MFLAGSARHDEDFIQGKIKERALHLSSQGKSHIYVYNKTSWQVKPWDYTGETFRVYLGREGVPPQIVLPESSLFGSDHTIDVPVELLPAFESQSITRALRDHCGIPSSEVGSFIVEIEKTRSRFDRKNIFTSESCTFQDGQPSCLSSVLYLVL